jgi:C-terminal processing protease CtpA/Prc
LGGSPSAQNFSSKLHPFFVNSKINIIDLGKGIFSRSDHYNFYKKDIPVLFFFTGIHQDYHTATDDEDKINYNGMIEISKVVEPIVAEFANTEERLIFEKMEDEQKTMQSPSKMKVTLGVMPDYAYDGKGVKADNVIDNRPGKISGMLDGDIVIKIQDMDIVDIYKYMEALSNIEPGDKVQITVSRDEEEVILDVQF